MLEIKMSFYVHLRQSSSDLVVTDEGCICMLAQDRELGFSAARYALESCLHSYSTQHKEAWVTSAYMTHNIQHSWEEPQSCERTRQSSCNLQHLLG